MYIGPYGTTAPSKDALLRQYEEIWNPDRQVSWEEHLSHLYPVLEYMLVRARHAANSDAESYRNYFVGCTVLAFNAYAAMPGERYKIFSGSNIKIYPDQPKLCAEPIAVAGAKNAGYKLIVGMVVVGTPQAENGKICSTLRPCMNCRTICSALDIVVPQTVIYTAHLEEDGIFEQFTMASLVQLQGDVNSWPLILPG